MRKLCPIFTLLVFNLNLQAQSISDTVKVIVEERLEMKIILKNYDLLKTETTKHEIQQYLEDFQKQVEQLGDELKASRAEELIYQGNGQLIVKNGAELEIYLITADELINSGSRDKGVIVHPKARIELTTADISDITEWDITKRFVKVVDSLPTQSRYAKTLNYSAKDDRIQFLSESINGQSAGDVIELSVGAGANLIKGQWVGEFQAKMDLMFFNKNILKHNPYLGYSLLYDFSGNERVNTYGFLNVGYAYDRSHGKGKENWFGVEAGFLLNNSSNQGMNEYALFEKNTWRFGLNWSPAKGITVSPQMFVVGGFEKVQPGLRISFGL